MDLWEGYKHDCLYNNDGPIDMSCLDKPTARRIPPGNRNKDAAKLERAVFLWAYRSMGLLGAVLLFVCILGAWYCGLWIVSGSTAVGLLISIGMYLHGMRRTLQEEQKEGLTWKQSLRKHWIASFSGVAIAVMLLVILAAAGVRGFQIHQLKRQVIDIAKSAGYEEVQVTADWHWESDWYDFTIEAETPDGKNTNAGIARLRDIKSIPYSERFSVYYTFVLNRWEVKV